MRIPRTVVLTTLALVVSSCTTGATDRVDATPTPAPGESATTTSLVTTTTSATTVTVMETEPTTTTTTPAPIPEPTYVVFMPRGLPEGFEALISSIDGFGAVTLRPTETLHIALTHDSQGELVDRPPPGFVIPVQGAAVNASTYARFTDASSVELLAELGADEILLTESSARLRRLDIGGRITFDDGRQVTVAAIVPDRVFGAEEVVTTNSALVGGAGSELRFALVSFAGTADQLGDELANALPEGSGFGVHARARPQDQTTAVRSQVWIKETFGEFAYQPTGNGRFTIDPAWVAENIVTLEIPLLGSTRCHRQYAELLTSVMESLIASGDADVIDRGAFSGCWNARYVANSMRVSRHAWGAAADINFSNGLDGGPGSPVNETLLEAMAAMGITSGHNWSIPDPGHFEYFGFPEDE